MARAEAEVACDGLTHTVALVEGDVVLVDHDEAAERVLEALGAATAGCLRLARMWRNAPWQDAVWCLRLDDGGAATLASGKTAAAAGVGRTFARFGTRARAVTVDGLETSAALLSLPLHLRHACGRRALAARVSAWRGGTPMASADRELLEHELDPFLGRRLSAEGRHLPPGGRALRVHVIGPGTAPALVPGRRAWDAHVPIDSVEWLLTTTEPLSPWFEGTA